MLAERVAAPGVTAAKLPAAAVTSRMDIDRDGRDEVVVGGYLRSGGYGVVVTYSGLPFRDLISDPIPFNGRPNFGDAMTSGDFNTDGYADLVVGNPGARDAAGEAFAGAVWVFYGGAGGLDLARPQQINQDMPGMPGDMVGDDKFGESLAAGDVNGDGWDDLAVGAPRDPVDGVEFAGSVTVLFGGSAGLTAAGVQMLSRATPGMPAGFLSFGTSVAVGDVTGDGYDDLAAGAPWGVAGPFRNGAVALLPGGPAGVTTSGLSYLLGDDVLVGGIGDILSIGDIDGDGDGDVVAGVPRTGIGYLVYIPGVPTGLDRTGARAISMETPGVPGDPQSHLPGDTAQTFFGEAVATGDVTGDGRADVLTGATSYDVLDKQDAGAVLLIPGTAEGLTGAGSLMVTRAGDTAWRREEPNILWPPATFDFFGGATSILNLDGVGPLDMLAGTSYPRPGGLLVELDLHQTVKRRPGHSWTLAGLVAVRKWQGSDVGASHIGHTILHH